MPRTLGTRGVQLRWMLKKITCYTIPGTVGASLPPIHRWLRTSHVQRQGLRPCPMPIPRGAIPPPARALSLHQVVLERPSGRLPEGRCQRFLGPLGPSVSWSHSPLKFCLNGGGGLGSRGAAGGGPRGKSPVVMYPDNRTQQNCSVVAQSAQGYATPSPAPRVGKPGGQRVGKRVGSAFYPTWRAGSKCWRLAEKKTYDAVLAV